MARPASEVSAVFDRVCSRLVRYRGQLGTGAAGRRLSLDGTAVASHSSAARLWNFAYAPEDRLRSHRRRGRYRTTSRGVVRPPLRMLGDESTSTHAVGHSVHVASSAHCATAPRCSRVPTRSYPRRRTAARTLLRVVRLKDCSRATRIGPGATHVVDPGAARQRGSGFDPGGSRSELECSSALRTTPASPAGTATRSPRRRSKTFGPDFAWPEHKVFAEYYGFRFISVPSAVVVRQRTSDRLLSAAGWLPLVFTDTHRTDREIIERTAACPALSAGGHGNVP